MNHLQSVTSSLTLAARFNLAAIVFVAIYAIAGLAAKMLPKEHPSRQYIEGRVSCGRSNCLTALRAPRKL